MELRFELNGKPVTAEIEAGELLFDVLRRLGCYSVKCGCETTNCGLCTVWVDGKPMLSCSVPAARMENHAVTTMEGLQEETARFGAFLAKEGAEQCGFCSPGFIMNVLAMEKELCRDGRIPEKEEIREYLAGNLCRCTGYVGQMRAVEKYLRESRG